MPRTAAACVAWLPRCVGVVVVNGNERQALAKLLLGSCLHNDAPRILAPSAAAADGSGGAAAPPERTYSMEWCYPWACTAHARYELTTTKDDKHPLLAAASPPTCLAGHPAKVWEVVSRGLGRSPPCYGRSPPVLWEVASQGGEGVPPHMLVR